MMDHKSSEITITEAAYHSGLGSDSSDQDNIDVTSLPKVIHVHEIDNSPQTPVRNVFNLEESGSMRCKNCNTNMEFEEKQCNNCGSLSDHNHENNMRVKDEEDRTSLSIDYTYKSLIDIKSNEFPKIRVENEEGISIHSNNDNTEDWTISHGVVKLDNNVNEESTAPPIRNVVEADHNTFTPTTEFSNRNTLEQNDFGDDKSLCSSFTENVKLIVY